MGNRSQGSRNLHCMPLFSCDRIERDLAPPIHIHLHALPNRPDLQSRFLCCLWYTLRLDSALGLQTFCQLQRLLSYGRLPEIPDHGDLLLHFRCLVVHERSSRTFCPSDPSSWLGQLTSNRAFMSSIGSGMSVWLTVTDSTYTLFLYTLPHIGNHPANGRVAWSSFQLSLAQDEFVRIWIAKVHEANLVHLTAQRAAGEEDPPRATSKQASLFQAASKPDQYYFIFSIGERKLVGPF